MGSVYIRTPAHEAFAKGIMHKVLIADQIGINRIGFRSLLESQGQLITLDEVDNAADLLQNLTLHDYDLLVLEPTIADGSSEMLLKNIKEIFPKSNILVLTSMNEVMFGIKAIQLGVRGYLVKTCSAEELVTAVLRVGGGGIYISQLLAELMVDMQCHDISRPFYSCLSERECQVFSMLVCGKTVTAIANVLDVSVKTVSTHKCRVMSKLHLDSISEVVKYAISQDLMEDCRSRSASINRRSDLN